MKMEHRIRNIEEEVDQIIKNVQMDVILYNNL